jgi:uncharacterized protein
MTAGSNYTLPFVRSVEGEIFLKVRLAPGSKRDRILGIHGDALRVAVSAPPERGKANEALVELIAKELDLPRSAVSLQSGFASRDKRLRIQGLSTNELLLRLRKVLS